MNHPLIFHMMGAFVPYLYLPSIGLMAFLIYVVGVRYRPELLGQTSSSFKYRQVAKPRLATKTTNSLPLEPNASRKSKTKWIDKEAFELERRAFFSKTWLPVTHVSRFEKPGDYRTFDVAGFSLLVILGKDDKLRAFHNVCRHRAYAITKKDCGSSSVLGCRYHGWSYNTKGQLTKAPEFENIEGFSKEENSLWQVRLEIRDSLVLVNVGSDEHVANLDWESTTLKAWGFPQMKCAAEWKADGAFSWKMLEFLVRPVHESERMTWLSIIPHWVYYPTTEILICHTAIVHRLTTSKILMIRALPQSYTTTILECTLFAKDARASHRAIEHAKRQVLLVVSRLIAEQKRILKKHQPLDPKGRLQPPGVVIDTMVEAHKEAENMVGTKINPASRQQHLREQEMHDDAFCKGLEASKSICSANAEGFLEW